MKPTLEQQEIIDNSHRSIKVQAGAGCGKTSLLFEICKQHPEESFLYLAFNKSVQQEVSEKAFNKGVMNLTVKTQNAWCLQLYSEFLGERISPDLYLKIDRKGLKKGLYISHIKEINTAFNISDDLFLKEKHTGINKRSKAYEAECWMRALEYVKEHYMNFNLTHDRYVKNVHLECIVDDRYDCILLDEAQDINPVFGSIIDTHKKHGIKIIAVGDTNQAIYGFRGAIDYLPKLDFDEFRMTQSFRFNHKIATYANSILKHLGDFRVSGESTSDPDQIETTAYVASTNASLIHQASGLAGSNQYFSLIGFNADQEKKAYSDLNEIFLDKKPCYFNELKGLTKFCLHDNEVLKDLGLEWENRIKSLLKSDLKSIITSIELIEEYNREDENYTLCTIHKSKGLEFDKVVMSNDIERLFTKKDEYENLTCCVSNGSETSLKLLYVALTRAKKQLVVPHFVQKEKERFEKGEK